MTTRTFKLLWCEHCGHADDHVRAPRLPDFALQTGELTCTRCNQPLTLLDASTAGGGHLQHGRWRWSAHDL